MISEGLTLFASSETLNIGALILISWGANPVSTRSPGVRGGEVTAEFSWCIPNTVWLQA